ncbi:MAG: serine/threonine-protein kinase [Planctomycetia bacterium]|nr:serine/threonine-protein kinase [Planctomycetia bacterium]
MSEPQPNPEIDTTVVHHPEPLLAATHSSLSPLDQTSAGEFTSMNADGPVVGPGSQLGPYQLLEKLGEGGMGAVYKAKHTKLGKLVALKILPQHVMSRPDALARFEREMMAVGALHHPNVVQAHDAGEFGGVHYLSMEYVEGQDLQVLVKAKGPLSVIKACKAIRQAALGLAAAHKLGLVHRDIKPSNLFVTKQGGLIKILDLGLALLSEEQTPAALTTTGQCFGTPDYMAPEQWEDAHACDARADLYSLGCTLFLLLTGRPPYGGDEYRSVPRKMMGHVRDPIPDLIAARADAVGGALLPDSTSATSPQTTDMGVRPTEEIPAELNAIYQKLMAKSPKDRFASAEQLADALAPFTRQSASSPR